MAGGLLFARLGMNRSLWVFALVGALGNLSYWALARFEGGTPALLMLLVVPFTLAAPRLAPVEHPLSSLRQAVVGPAREFLHRTGGSRAILLLALVLLYRWPDGLLNLMAVPFLIQQGFSPEVVGSVLA